MGEIRLHICQPPGARKPSLLPSGTQGVREARASRGRACTALSFLSLAEEGELGAQRPGGLTG